MRHIIIIFAIILLSWSAGFAYYLYLINSYKIDTSTTTEVIVVFTGGRQRIETGISLLKAGYSPLLFVVGIDSPNQLKNLLVEYKVKQTQVIYGQTDMVQKDNAKEVADFITANNISSIRLVTSSYDMPIAIEELTKRVSATSNLHIVPHPVISQQNEYKLLLAAYNNYLKILFIN
jgi:uncharacterized SAM-binding protein YcdF (DUF218 family)